MRPGPPGALPVGRNDGSTRLGRTIPASAPSGFPGCAVATPDRSPRRWTSPSRQSSAAKAAGHSHKEAEATRLLEHRVEAAAYVAGQRRELLAQHVVALALIAERRLGIGLAHDLER